MGEKRSGDELRERPEIGGKRVKTRDLQSLLATEDIDSNSKSSKTGEVNDQDASGVTEVTTASNAAHAEAKARDLLLPQGQLDLNTKVCASGKLVCDVTPACVKESNRCPPLVNHDVEHDVNSVTSRGIGLDLNSEGVARSVNQDAFYPYRKRDRVKSPDGVSECGSSTGPIEEKDPMKVWKEMKQNGFLSANHGCFTHGGIPVPKQRGRKAKQDVMKKKIELAKKEQVDRFTKIAAPSGLLNELNPGIINHVRNSKQVHSIIEALVRSEKHENDHAGSRKASHSNSGSREISDKKDPENVNDLGKTSHHLSHHDGPSKTMPMNHPNKSWNLQLRGNPMLAKDNIGDGDSRMIQRRFVGRTSCGSSPTNANEDDILALKLASSTTTKASENISLSNEEPVNLTSVTSLSVRAATVASQWLELLHQDIKGRLAALRRSKKRVRAVIHTELPFLMSKEFSSNQENNPNVTKDSASTYSAEMHRARWSALFGQMDKSLFEEEKQLVSNSVPYKKMFIPLCGLNGEQLGHFNDGTPQLYHQSCQPESWLNQVKEMQMHCERGLHHIQWNLPHCQNLGTTGSDSRSQTANDSERELAIRAAAASIYSTCNFLLSMENVPCF